MQTATPAQAESIAPRAEVIEQLKAIVGPSGFLQGVDISEKNYRDWMGARAEAPLLLLRPETSKQVSQILAACNEAGQPVSVQGGLTGLVAGSAPLTGEVAISFERMRQIIETDPYSCTMTLEAGVELQRVQEAADEAGLLFPLDLGARGSCTIGGNLSTNAGGNRVIRYGMTRDLVLGVEAVLADGTIIDGMSKLRKNNTGYDLKQLFIGSEGTLGLITRAVLKLAPRPASQAVALCGLHRFEQVAELLVHTQAQLGANLSAFEVIWNNSYRLIDAHVPHVTVPLPLDFGFYVLIESMGADQEKDEGLFLRALESAAESGLVEDVIVANSESRQRSLWAVRDAAAEASHGVGYMHPFDISINVSDMGYFGEEVQRRLRALWPEAIIGLFGHIGDGNLHILVHIGKDTRAQQEAIDDCVYQLVRELRGSVSAEHGIGMMKRAYLEYSRSPEEIALMRSLKNTMDPKGILNPGRVL